VVILTASHQKHPDYLLVFQRSNCFVIWDTRLSVPRDRRDLTFNGKHQKARSGEKKEHVGVNVWYVKDNKGKHSQNGTDKSPCRAQPKELDVIT